MKFRVTAPGSPMLVIGIGTQRVSATGLPAPQDESRRIDVSASLGESFSMITKIEMMHKSEPKSAFDTVRQSHKRIVS